MKPAAESKNPHRQPTTTRFNLVLFVVVELLCTGAVVAWVVL